MREPILNHRRALALLRAEGYRVARNGRGRHGTKLVKPGDLRPIVVPRHGGKDYGRGLTHQILKQAGIKPTEAQRWSSRSSSRKSQGRSGPRSTSSQDVSRQAER